MEKIFTNFEKKTLTKGKLMFILFLLEREAGV